MTGKHMGTAPYKDHQKNQAHMVKLLTEVSGHNGVQGVGQGDSGMQVLWETAGLTLDHLNRAADTLMVDGGQVAILGSLGPQVLVIFHGFDIDEMWPDPEPDEKGGA